MSQRWEETNRERERERERELESVARTSLLWTFISPRTLDHGILALNEQ